jgi:hypothetical protein
MEKSRITDFLDKWKKYFGNANLPLVFFYSDDPGDSVSAGKKGSHCMICSLSEVKKGENIFFKSSSVHCAGGRRYAGFPGELRKNFDYFLSCGIPGVMEGERYKKDPALVRHFMDNFQPVPASGEYLIFKRWDKLSASDQPRGVVFFARPDILSGLFTLANYDRKDPDGVIAPFSSGCGSIIMKVLQEENNANPRCILGMFDPSARHCLDPGVLTFAVPFHRFLQMTDHIDESFLITSTWADIRNRL